MTTCGPRALRRAFAVIAVLVVSLTISACDGLVGPRGFTGYLKVHSRGVGDDTIGSVRVNVELSLRDQSGWTRTGDEVLLSAVVPEGMPTVTFPSDPFSEGTESVTQVDATGRVRFSVRLGTRAGRVWVRVLAYGLRDSLAFDIKAGQPAGVTVAPRDTAMFVSRTMSLRASATDRGGNPVPGAVSFVADSTAASVAAGGIVSTQAFGRARIRVTFGSWADTAWVSVVPTAVIAALRPAADPRPLQLIRFGLDGSDVTVIKSGLITYPEWHPSGDGRLLAVDEDYYQGRAMLIAADLSMRPLLSTFQEYETWDHTPRWSGDGEWIFFSGRNSIPTIWRARADGSEPERLTPESPFGGDYFPAPSPDGQRVVFSRLRSLVWSTKVLHIASGSERDLPFWSDQIRWLPNGTGLVALVGAQVIVTDTAGVTLRSIAVPRDMESQAEPGLALSPDGAWALLNADLLPEFRSRQTLLIRLADGLLLPLPYSRGLAWPSWKP